MLNSFVRLRWVKGSVVGVLLLGCSSTGETNPVEGSAGSGGSAAGGGNNSGGGSVVPEVDVHGSVIVSLLPASGGDDAYATLTGRFFDGPTPDVLQLELASEAGECQLLVPFAPFCNEACTPGVCTADDECTPYPKPLGLGSLDIGGLGDALSLKPASAMQVYQAPSMPNPPCEAGTQVSATAVDHGLALEAECIGQLELTGPDPVPVMSGEPVVVSWSTTGSAPSSRVLIRLDIAHHGGKKGEIVCDVPDSGEFAIPEPLVTELVGLGLAGYPDISVTRVARGVDAKHENAVLVLSSNVLRPVDTGVASCQETSQCPDDQVCLDTKVCG